MKINGDRWFSELEQINQTNNKEKKNEYKCREMVSPSGFILNYLDPETDYVKGKFIDINETGLKS